MNERYTGRAEWKAAWRVSVRPEDHFAWSSAADVISAPTSYSVGDVDVPLSVSQQVEWILHWDEEYREDYIEALKAKHSASTNADAASPPPLPSTTESS